ncbi:MAG: ABC transporter permease [Calditrichia bacterium]
MINFRTKAILKRELKSQVLTWSFILSTLIIPILYIVFIGFQFFLVLYEEDRDTNLVIVEESPFINDQLSTRIEAMSDKLGAELNTTFITMSRNSFQDYLGKMHESLREGITTGVLFIPDSAKTTKTLEYYSANPVNLQLLEKFRRVIDDVLVEAYFSESPVHLKDLAYAKQFVSFDKIKISADGQEEAGYSNLAIAYILTFMLYSSLLTIGSSIFSTITEEKENRLVEVLLASVQPQELMSGKILGTLIAGLLQVLVWAAPIAFVGFGSLQFIQQYADINLQINAVQIVYFLINYSIGLITFLGIYAAAGAVFDSAKDAQRVLIPVMLVVTLSFYLTFTMIKNPANSIATTFSLLPFSSLIIMPARMTLIDVPWWQLLTTTGINIITMYASLRVAGKLYRVGILMTGKKPGVVDLWRMLRA